MPKSNLIWRYVKTRKNRLWLDLTFVLIIKATLFFFLWLMFFAHPAAEYINTNQIYVDHLLSTSKES